MLCFFQMSDYLLYGLSIIPCLFLFLFVSYPKFPSGIISFLLEKLPFAIVSEQVSWLKSFLNFFLLRISSFTFISKGHFSLDIEIWANGSFLLSFKQYCVTTRRLAGFLRWNSWCYLYLSHMASVGPWSILQFISENLCPLFKVRSMHIQFSSELRNSIFFIGSRSWAPPSLRSLPSASWISRFPLCSSDQKGVFFYLFCFTSYFLYLHVHLGPCSRETERGQEKQVMGFISTS